MPRLRNTKTGVVVDVSDDRAKSLGREFVPVEGVKPEPKSVPKGRRKSADKD